MTYSNGLTFPTELDDTLCRLQVLKDSHEDSIPAPCDPFVPNLDDISLSSHNDSPLHISLMKRKTSQINSQLHNQFKEFQKANSRYSRRISSA